MRPASIGSQSFPSLLSMQHQHIPRTRPPTRITAHLTLHYWLHIFRYAVLTPSGPTTLRKPY